MALVPGLPTSAQRLPVDFVRNVDDLASLWLEKEREFLEIAQGFTYPAVILFFPVEQEKSSSTSPEELAADRTGLARGFVIIIDGIIANGFYQAAFQAPPFVEDLAEAV